MSQILNSMHEGDGFFSEKTLGKSLVHFQTDWLGKGPWPNKAGNERQPPPQGVRFTEVSVKSPLYYDDCGTEKLKSPNTVCTHDTLEITKPLTFTSYV